MGVLRFSCELRLGVFILYREIYNIEIKFYVKNTFVDSYSRAIIA